MGPHLSDAGGPAGGPPTPPGGSAHGWAVPAAPPDLARELDAGRRARLALWAGLVACSIQVACSVVATAANPDLYRDLFDDLASGRAVTPPPTSAVAAGASVVSQVANVAYLVAGVVFLVWFHRALTTARSVGLPLTRSPAWGVAGFIVPIVNLWFPYQSMRDLFPSGHAARDLVGRWWACFLVAGFAGLAVVAAAFASVLVAVVAALANVALYTIAAVTARHLVAASTAAHRELAMARWPAASRARAEPAPS